MFRFIQCFVLCRNLNNCLAKSCLLKHYNFSDNNECTLNTHNCHSNGDCTNTPGSFTCKCKTGYSGDGVTCTGKMKIEFGNIHFDSSIFLSFKNIWICKWENLMRPSSAEKLTKKSFHIIHPLKELSITTRINPTSLVYSGFHSS